MRRKEKTIKDQSEWNMLFIKKNLGLTIAAVESTVPDNSSYITT